MILALVAGTSAFAPVMPKTRWVSAVNGLGDADYVKEIEDYKKEQLAELEKKKNEMMAALEAEVIEE
eukprot:CAMPEP_0185747016 /NCGR_PEP_ID=MMETSP1174-20130828/5696_1 /TAXON_ID=35687 /ORGANISM="Dictyocha speculum, Strain CCMP1381" /LENGTH=66 /DNA_ID=CAMNT_0028422029 /DNA_START=95 /DNA_END=295 /DNA_ORIENTATION=+